MSKYIDADLYVDMQIYDEQHEEWGVWHGTIEDLLNQWTEQGCPLSIEINENNEHSVHYEIGYKKGKQSKCEGCCLYKIGFEDGKLEMIRMVEDALKKRGGE